MSTKQFIKNNKRWFSALALTMMVGIATVTFAFKTDVKNNSNHNANKVFASKWYQYNGGTITDESSYSLLATQPVDNAAAAALCPNTGKICVIYAPEGTGGQPATFSSALIGEINTAQTNNTESTNVKLRN